MIKLDMNFILGNLCVDIKLWSKKEKQFKTTDAIFDTGAHITHIDTIALKNLGYDLDDAKESYITTVGRSNIQVKNTIIDNIKIGELELGAALINFSELTDISSPVILGMNIIKEFNIELDFKNKSIAMNPNFDIDSANSAETFHKDSSRFGLWTIGIDKV